jgi:hypothetical protein
VLLNRSRSSRLKVGELFLFVREGLLISVQHQMGAHPLDVPVILDATETSLGAGSVAALYGVMFVNFKRRHWL